MKSVISVKGARTHNLQDIALDLPRDQLIVVTGLSGSGKSSLVFNTLYAKAERRFVESLSPYARQFISMMEEPDVDQIEGLSPAIAIQQKTISHNPRSTVGTVTEIYDYLRVLFARIGQPRCPQHHISLAAKSISQMADHIFELPEDTRFLLLAPMIQKKKGEHRQLLEELRAKGYVRVRLNGIVKELNEVPLLDRNKQHSIEVVVDRLAQRLDLKARIVDSLTTTVNLSDGLVHVVTLDEQGHEAKKIVFSAKAACPECDYSISNLEPRFFSFNNALGACPECNGLGAYWGPQPPYDVLQAISEDTTMVEHAIEKHQSDTELCSACQGDRLRLEARHVFISDTALTQLTRMPLHELQHFFNTLVLHGNQARIADLLLKEINNRVKFLMDVGLDYLSLSRAARTLSNGESARIRLASQIGSGLVGVMYVLDEPSTGLHPRDNTRLINSLKQLKSLGNTVIVVEHDDEIMQEADYLVDVGPGAGIHGGKIVAQGTPTEVMGNDRSLTGQYLSNKKMIRVPERYKVDQNRMLCLKNITKNNLKNVTLGIPVGLMTCVTGVSGSGKSTLIHDTLFPQINRYLNQSDKRHVPLQLSGIEHFDKVIEIDQKPIGRTPRSNPATYTGLLGPIRELFASLPKARARGYKEGRFSFNVKGGRCEACEGVGVIQVEMHFLADIHVQCDVCRGQRYNRETLEIRYKDKNIYEVLEMTVEEAKNFFQAIPVLQRKLQTLLDVGLSYIKLGQNATTLSGGEAQRVKLSSELSKRATGRTIYILDEPTTGLHFYDVEQLLNVLYRLRDQGNTVVVVEHNLQVIKTADWIVDLGPEGGDQGGHILCCGTPEQVARESKSYTGRYLKPLLNNH